jgi:hypothetical protein
MNALSSDPLTAANAKMAAMALALAQARAFVKHDAEHPAITDGFQDYARGVLARIDQALEGTIHSFTLHGARR